MVCVLCCLWHTSRDHSLNTSAIDESPLDGLSPDIWPVDAVLQSIIVHHGHVIDVRHGKGNNVVVVRVVDVHSSDLYLSGVEQKLTRLCRGDEMSTGVLQYSMGVIGCLMQLQVKGLNAWVHTLMPAWWIDDCSMDECVCAFFLPLEQTVNPIVCLTLMIVSGWLTQ